eukprot:1155283-Pelagomonas_calceolata.AAC.8
MLLQHCKSTGVSDPAEAVRAQLQHSVIAGHTLESLQTDIQPLCSSYTLCPLTSYLIPLNEHHGTHVGLDKKG